MARTDPIALLDARYVTEQGWRDGSTVENRVARILADMRLQPVERQVRLMHVARPAMVVHEQYRVPPYRLDFAWPPYRLALEADGWHHVSDRGYGRDRARDATLRSAGWLVFRVDGEAPYDELRAQVERVHDIVLAVHLEAGRR